MHIIVENSKEIGKGTIFQRVLKLRCVLVLHTISSCKYASPVCLILKSFEIKNFEMIKFSKKFKTVEKT